jgi:hypothetical protein
MQIEWSEGAASRFVGTVPRSTADDTVPEAGYCEKMLRKECVRKPEEEICSAIRRRATNRGEARRVFLMRRVVSCNSGDPRWRTKLYLGSGKPLDDHHRFSTLGAEPKISGVLGVWGVLLCLGCRAEQLKAQKQESGTSPVGQESKMSDAYEVVRKQVQQEATQEFHRARESSCAVRSCERSRASGPWTLAVWTPSWEKPVLST